MGLSVNLYDPTAFYDTDPLYDGNTTHNLGRMAEEADIYDALWRPYKLAWGYTKSDDYDEEMEFENSVMIKAKDIIPKLEVGLEDLIKRPEYYEQFNSPNGWGMYEHFVPFVSKYLDACKEYPEAIVKVDR